MLTRKSLALLAVAGTFSSCDVLFGSQAPHGYACGDTTGDHCYAEAFVGDHTTGFRSTITVAPTFQAGNGLITNELWLNNYTGNRGWIELGYKNVVNERPQYFWAQMNPEGFVFTFHDIAPVPDAELGTRVTFDVHQIGPDQFLLSIDGGVTRWSQTIALSLWTGTAGGYVALGQELGGTDGGQASLALFVDNMVYDQAFAPRFAAAQDRPSESLDGPPYGGWLEVPDAGNRGGVFSTRCCAP